MEIVIFILGLLLNAIGIAGAILPGIPGPIVSWVALLLVYFVPDNEVGLTLLLVTLGIAILLVVLDAIIPVFGAKALGSTRQGLLGGVIGVIIGIFFFPPIGIILGPLFGTILGDLAGGNNIRKSIHSGAGTVVGFVVGTLMKLIYSAVIAVLFFKEVGVYVAGLF